MTAATMIKRINSTRKEIARYEKEIEYHKKSLAKAEAEFKAGEQINIEYIRVDTQKWIAYYRRLIAEHEDKVAELSKKASAIATEEEKQQMTEAMIKDVLDKGIKFEGHTTTGKRYWIEPNWYGITERHLHCVTMWIEGQGLVFTSGTIQTVARYILHN